jgi:hypothetical protein
MSGARAELAAALLVLLALPARAVEVARDAHGGVLEVSGFAKSLVSASLLNPRLVEASHARVRLLEETAALLPPGTLPEVRPLPDGAVLGAQVVRLASRFRFKDTLELEAAWQGQVFIASDPAFATAGALSGTVGGTGVGAQRRLVELGGPLASGSTWRLDHQVDRLALKLALPFGDLTVGRQVLSWGTGKLWNPTDVLSPFPPTVIDREVRRGFDAVRLAVALGDVTQLDLLWLPQPKAEDHGGVARFQTNVSGWDVSVSAGKYVKDLVFGADVVGDVGPVGVHAEGAYTVELLGLGTGSVSVGEHFFRGVVGAMARPHEKVMVVAEYAFNGFGTNDPAKLAAVLASPRVLRGEVFGGGMHQAALTGSFAASEVLSVSLTALGNLADPSALLIPAAEYSLTQRVLLRAGGYVPLGRWPDATLYDGLTPADVLVNSAAFQAANATRGLRSEYGSSSFGAFLQVGAYLP